MNEQGIGYIADMLVFALLISFASLLLVGASPIDPKIGSTRYAASFAQSTLLALQHSTADEFGGFKYQLNTLSSELNVPVLKGSTKRNLRHKTLIQLLVEDALLNLQIEAERAEVEPLGPSWDMNNKLREFLKGMLDKLIGGRFGYRLIVRSLPLDLGFVWVHFESEIKNLNEGARRKLCSETIVATLPISQEELTRQIQKVLDTMLELEPDIAIEITLELWPS